MAYDLSLAERVRDFLLQRPAFFVEEKKMFGGLAFLVNGKMCINVSRKGLMCRFDPSRTAELSLRPGFQALEMNSQHMSGFCYVTADGYASDRDFNFWLQCCLDYNPEAPISKKRK